MKNTVNKAIAAGKIAVYVFDKFYAEEYSINGYDAIKSRYVKPTAKTMIYAGKSYQIEMKRLGCGVHMVPCIFVEKPSNA